MAQALDLGLHLVPKHRHGRSHTLAITAKCDLGKLRKGRCALTGVVMKLAGVPCF